MKRGLQKIAVLFLSTVIFVSYLPWNAVFAEDEGNAFSQNVISDEAEGENGKANPEDADNPKGDSQKDELENSEASQKEKAEESKAEPLTNTLGNYVEENDDNLSKSRKLQTRGAKSPEDYFLFNEQTKTIVGYSSDVNAPKAIKIPATINGINVEHIGDKALAGQQLTELSFELPSNLKSIGSNAFSANRFLKGSVTIPNGVISIGEAAFRSCSSITSVTIPEGVTSIEDYAFDDCSSLTSISIPEGVTRINNGIFDGCSSLTSITIPESVTSIGSSAFKRCSSLTSITLPNGVSSIEYYAFQLCESLTSISIPEGVTRIENGIFENCKSLTSITIPERVTSIGNSAFYGCSSLIGITIPESVTSIKDNAFIYCNSLRKINIPTKNRGEISGESWGANNAIVYWKDTKVVDDFILDITKGEIVKYIGTKTDLTVPSIFNIDGNEYKINSICKSAFYENKNVKTVNIQKGITSIGQSAFYNCSLLTSVTIPEEVTSIGQSAFQNCSSLTSVTIPESVTSIGQRAFHNCSSLKSITIPESVTSIEMGTFENCSSLKSIGIPERVTSIGRGAFAQCSSLIGITIPESVTSIKDDAFIYCKSLRKINIPTKNRGEISGESWGAKNAIVYWKDIKVLDDFVIDIYKGEIVKYIGTKTDLTVPSILNIDGKEWKINSIFEYAFNGNKNVKTVNIQKGITSIGHNAFEYCTSLTSVTIPEGVTSIGHSAFQNCSSLTSVTIPEGVTSIGHSAFYYCSSLTSITIPESVTRIEIKTFHNCISLKNITIPESVTRIGERAFVNCSSLTSITLPNGVTRIENGTFYDCSSLTSVTIPEGVTNIESRAFLRCSSLTRVNIPEGMKDISDDSFQNSGIETIYVDQNRATSPLAKNQPWGASNTAKVYYKGEFVSIDTTSEKVKGEYARNIKIEAYIDKQKFVSKIVMPDGKIVNIGNPTWTGEFKVTKNGTYVFKGYDDSGNEAEKVVTIDDIGKPIVSAENVTIDYEPKKITKTELYKLLKASAIDELDVDVPVTVTDADLEKVKKIRNGETVEVTVKATHPKFNISDSKKASVTLNLPDVIPGSQDKPEGYVTVTFAKGDHGKLEGETSQHVNPTKVTDLKALAPKVKAEIGFKHIGWDKELKAKFEKDTTVTATYKALPDVIPGSQDKPEGYVTVTFAKGEHGSLSGEMSQHVNPTKEVDLKTLAPKVKADIGFKHTGWNGELKKKFTEDTTITATYEALPDVIPGSQDKPEGYVTVTFAKGDHGKLEGETSQHVNPTKVTDLKKLAPKVKADVGFKHIGWDKELKAKFEKDTTVTATYKALPDVIPGSQDKPEGYVTVTFAKGEHGSLSGELSQHVNPTKVTDLKTLVPKVKADIGFKHTGWDKELKAKFEKDTTVTATYEALPDIIPGSQDKPEGYVTVTFAKGDHGKLEGETSQHVNPTKVTDLKTLAPKVKADIGFKHTGWNSELKKKFTEDTTITATYEAVTEKFAITIDPDGGSWNGNTDPIVYNIEKGEYITLPDAPTKEGYTFKYWKGSKYMPGDKYKVEGEHKFTAVWEKKASSKTDDNSTGTTGTSGTAGANGANMNKTSTSNHAPFTADSQNIVLHLMMSIFSFVLMLRVRVKEN